MTKLISTGLKGYVAGGVGSTEYWSDFIALAISKALGGGDET